MEDSNRNELIKITNSSDGSSDMNILQKMVDTDNKMRYVQGIGSRLENSIYNSVEIKELMRLESEDCGNMTITQLLDAYQDMHNEGRTRMFSDLADRKKPANPSRVEELILEISTYRAVLSGLQSTFAKKRKGSALRSFAEVIMHFIDKIDSGWRINVNQETSQDE